MNKFIIMVLALALGACSTTSFNTATMKNPEYMKLSSEAKQAYLAAVQEEYDVILKKVAVEYATGRPIFMGDAQTGYTVQWDRNAKLMHVYPGHKPEGMGVETFVAMTFQTDSLGVPVLNKDGTIARPLFVNAATQEDLTRSLLKIFAGSVPAALNGAVAAGIASSSQCKGASCGNNFYIQGGQGGTAASLSGAGATAGVKVDTNIGNLCTTRSCLAQ